MRAAASLPFLVVTRSASAPGPSSTVTRAELVDVAETRAREAREARPAGDDLETARLLAERDQERVGVADAREHVADGEMERLHLGARVAAAEQHAREQRQDDQDAGGTAHQRQGFRQLQGWSMQSASAAALARLIIASAKAEGIGDSVSGSDSSDFVRCATSSAKLRAFRAARSGAPLSRKFCDGVQHEVAGGSG